MHVPNAVMIVLDDLGFAQFGCHGDNRFVEPPLTPEEGYHLTEDLAAQAIRMVQDQQQAEPGKPFFLYLATAAPHSPHQVPDTWIEPTADGSTAGERLRVLAPSCRRGSWALYRPARSTPGVLPFTWS